MKQKTHMRDPDGPENKANYPSAQFTAQSDIMNYYKLSSIVNV